MNARKVQTVNLCKVYPGTVALNNVSIAFEPGKVHALIGKNGAGKSTVVKILSGAVQPTSGQILVDGKEAVFRSPRDAFREGIATVYQELNLVPELTVGENILLGRFPKRRVLGGLIVDWTETLTRAQAILENIHVDLDVRKKVRELGVAQQQLVEIAKAIGFNSSVLILDEPTSALAHHEVQNLFSLVRHLAGDGVTIIYITHRLHELREVADLVSVLRDGNLVGTIGITEATPDTIARMMFGEIVRTGQPVSAKTAGEPVLEVRHLSRKGKLYDIHFTLHKGEILGIAGMLGSGRTELLKAIFGADPVDEAEIVVNGRVVAGRTPRRMKLLGVGLTPESRKEEGLVQIMTVRDNLCLASMSRISWNGIIWKRRQRPVVEKMVKELGITVSDTDRPVSSLSGGNQQKVVFGNWLNTGPQIMLFDEPTRGIDIQAKQQIFQIMRDLSGRGISSIFVSSELEELLEVCHRILVMQNGHIVTELSTEGLGAEKLLELTMTH